MKDIWADNNPYKDGTVVRPHRIFIDWYNHPDAECAWGFTLSSYITTNGARICLLSLIMLGELP